jgi:hypothetical protein
MYRDSIEGEGSTKYMHISTVDKGRMQRNMDGRVKTQSVTKIEYRKEHFVVGRQSWKEG